ncbi:MAG: cyclodeaminase/cyclohydrolase family protein [Negativicutes bacterium]|nr:cyclodeaminase/cyclohydrolase family protein [Negativicutes bacterium]
MLTELTIKDFAVKLASEEPAPGGGSAAALSGLLAVSLMEMVINLTLGRAEYAAYEALLADKQEALKRLHLQMESLIERDAAAFNAVMAAFKLPKASEEEKKARTAAVQRAFREAAEVPLETARACLEALEIGQALLGKVNSHAVSDLVVGALAGHTGVVGALLNTAINLPSIKDEMYVKAVNGQINLLKASADELVQAIQAVVYQDAAFAELRN